ncbi:MAG: EamA family transporter [Chitinivibrionales bacterium]|nr:EamA family transporter [Chitinivibrionales bacterium]
MTWIYLSLVSALLVSLRHIYIKRFCHNVPAEILVFLTRLLGALVMSVYALKTPLTVKVAPSFAGVVSFTVVATAVATIAQIRVIQKNPLSKSVPYLTLIPLSMIPWSALLLGEMPSLIAAPGLIMACIGAYILNSAGAKSVLAPVLSIFRNRHSLYMLGAAVLLGATTTCDKIAIHRSSAFTYMFIWTCASVVVMALFCIRYDIGLLTGSLRNRHVIIQALLWVGGFSAQMVAVQHALGITSGTTYVKMLTLTNTLFSVLIGGPLLREKHLTRSIVAAILMIAGSTLVIAGSK